MSTEITPDMGIKAIPRSDRAGRLEAAVLFDAPLPRYRIHRHTETYDSSGPRRGGGRKETVFYYILLNGAAVREGKSRLAPKREGAARTYIQRRMREIAFALLPAHCHAQECRSCGVFFMERMESCDLPKRGCAGARLLSSICDDCCNRDYAESGDAE